MDQVIISGGNNAPSASTVEYLGLYGGSLWHATESARRQVMPANGTLKNLYVDTRNAVGSGDTLTFVLMVNGSPSALTTSISGASQKNNNDTVNDVSVSKGDLVSMRCTPSGTPFVGQTTFCLMFTGDVEGESIIMGSSGGTFSPSGTEFCSLGGPTSTPNISQVNVNQVMPTAGVISDFYVALDIDPGTNPDAYRLTVQKEDIDTALLVVITADATTGNDVVNSFSVIASDTVNIEIKPISTPSATPVGGWGVVFTATKLGRSVILGGGNDVPSNSVTEYGFMCGHQQGGWATSELQQNQVGQVFTLKHFYIKMTNAPGAGKTRTFNTRIDTGNGNISVAITGTDTEGSDTVHEDSISAGQLLNIRHIPSGTPNNSTPHWGLVCSIGEVPDIVPESGSNVLAQFMAAGILR